MSNTVVLTEHAGDETPTNERFVLAQLDTGFWCTAYYDMGEHNWVAGRSWQGLVPLQDEVARWFDFPEGGRPCELEARISELERMIDRLIEAGNGLIQDTVSDSYWHEMLVDERQQNWQDVVDERK